MQYDASPITDTAPNALPSDEMGGGLSPLIRMRARARARFAYAARAHAQPSPAPDGDQGTREDNPPPFHPPPRPTLPPRQQEAGREGVFARASARASASAGIGASARAACARGHGASARKMRMLSGVFARGAEAGGRRRG